VAGDLLLDSPRLVGIDVGVRLRVLASRAGHLTRRHDGTEPVGFHARLPPPVPASSHPASVRTLASPTLPALPPSPCPALTGCSPTGTAHREGPPRHATSAPSRRSTRRTAGIPPPTRSHVPPRKSDNLHAVHRDVRELR